MKLEPTKPTKREKKGIVIDVDTGPDFLDRPEPRYGPDGHLGRSVDELLKDPDVAGKLKLPKRGTRG